MSRLTVSCRCTPGSAVCSQGRFETARQGHARSSLGENVKTVEHRGHRRSSPSAYCRCGREYVCRVLALVKPRLRM